MKKRKSIERKMQQLLAQKDQRANLLDAILTNITDYVYMFDKECRYIYISPKAAETFGLDPDSLIGKTWQELGFSSEIMQPFEAHLRTVLKTGDTIKGELELSRDGTAEYYEYIISPAWKTDRGIETVVVSSRDITERKSLFEDMRQAKERASFFANAVEKSSQPFVAIHPDGLLMQYNHAYVELTGYSSDELHSMNMKDLTPPEYHEYEAARLEELRITGKPELYQKEYIRKDKTRLPIEVKIHLQRNPKGDIEYYYGFVTDITERKRAEEKLKEANEHLEASNMELEAFSYSVSHDLRAPLRHMSGFASFLQEILADHPDERVRRFTTAIIGASTKMQTLIDDLLSFSLIVRSEMKMTNVSLKSTLNEAVQEIRDEVKGRDIAWKIDELPEVYGDPSLLKLVFVNLISNSVKYTRTRPQAAIKVGCNYKDNEIVCSVKDNGVGFDMQNADKLFGVFQRLHKQEEFEGTGIGLANVRRIISRHGGRTWAAGAVNRGATFYFTLPKTTSSNLSV